MSGKGMLRLLGALLCLCLSALLAPAAYARPMCSITLTSPQKGQTLVTPPAVSISLSGTITCDTPLQVTIFDNGQPILSPAMTGGGFNYSFSTTWDNVPAGVHSFSATVDGAYDSATVGSTVVVTVVSTVVTGNIDSVSADGWISGWACSTYRTDSIGVDLYLGGPYGTGAGNGHFVANQSSEPAVASACKVGSGSFRFNIPLNEAQRLQFAGQKIYIYGISPVGAASNLLGNSGNLVVPTPTPNAQFVSQSVNTTMQTGSTQNVTVQFKNTGTRTWTGAAAFRLGSQNPQDNGTWNISRVGVPSDIAPGQTATFTFQIRAPSTPGNYNFQWRMLQESVTWFGDYGANVVITVNPPPPVVSTYSSVDYDELGRVIARRDSAGNIKVSYTYDADNNITKVTDALNRSTTVDYDAFSRPIKSTDPAGGITQYAYDTADNLVQVTDPRGKATTYTYDGFAQLWTQVSPDTGTASYTYDASGQRTGMVRNDGSSLTYGYDGMGRLTSVSGGQQVRSYTYDSCTNGKGRLCGFSSAVGATTQTWTQFTYTVDGLIATRDDAMQSTENLTAYNYDDSGRVTGISYPSGVSVGYAYSYGKLSAATVTANGTTSNLATGVNYQPLGPVAGWTVGNGLARGYGYDSDGRLTGISTGNASGVLQSLTYGFNAADEMTAATNGFNTGLSQQYAYDALSRLTKQTYGSGGQQLREYDASDNLTHNNGPWDEYPVIDPASNRATSMGPHSYGYDARGNRSSYYFQYDASTATYTYDAFNRLSQYSRNVATTFGEPNGPNGEAIYHPAGSWSYLYDAQDQRVGKSGPDGQTRYVYGAPGQLLAEYGPNGWKSYLWLGGQLVGVYSTSAGLGFVHTDHLGRPELVTNGAQQTTWRAANYAFGRTVLQDAIGGLNIGFPGQYLDAESGTWQNGFRDYDSRLGRYLQSDPTGMMGGINTYAYAMAKPTSNTDARGLETGIAYKAIYLMDGGVPNTQPVRLPDIYQFEVGRGPITASAVFTRYGDAFVGLSFNPTEIAKGGKAQIGGVAISIGYLMNCDNSRDTLNGVIKGISGGASYYYGAGGGFVTNDSGTIIMGGVGAGQFSYGTGYTQYTGNIFTGTE